MGSINTILEGNTTVLSGPNLVSFHQVALRKKIFNFQSTSRVGNNLGCQVRSLDTIITDDHP
jgi:hypothetical protein